MATHPLATRMAGAARRAAAGLGLAAAALGLGGGWPAAAGEAAAVAYPAVRAGTPLAFPRDHGAHPEFRIEWWYLTGWLEDGRGAARGFQLTFFRLRPGVQERNPSAFAPTQLLFAHAAIADPAYGRLRHAERSARAGFALAAADTGDTRVHLDRWSLHRESAGPAGGDRYVARVRAEEFAYELVATAGQAPLLQGDRGYSRKGRDPANASYYYSRPQLAIDGWIEVDGRRQAVRGRAWLDHEWSSSAMPEGAVGWDWLGANLDDGGALMAFRLRDAGGRSLWAGGSLWAPGAPPRSFGPDEIEFTPRRRWRSPRTGGEYAVETGLRAGPLQLTVEPLFDDQELDSRGSVGAVYWEGAARLRDASGRELGRGYLEITGALARLRM